MWEGACPRWQCVSHYMHDCSTAIGGKPPPTFLTAFGLQDQVGYKAAPKSKSKYRMKSI